MLENRFKTYAESNVWDTKFEAMLTREQAVDMMNDLARELEEAREEIEERDYAECMGLNEEDGK